jgi:hypothetical protein
MWRILASQARLAKGQRVVIWLAATAGETDCFGRAAWPVVVGERSLMEPALPRIALLRCNQ